MYMMQPDFIWWGFFKSPVMWAHPKATSRRVWLCWKFCGVTKLYKLIRLIKIVRCPSWRGNTEVGEKFIAVFLKIYIPEHRSKVLSKRFKQATTFKCVWIDCECVYRAFKSAFIVLFPLTSCGHWYRLKNTISDILSLNKVNAENVLSNSHQLCSFGVGHVVHRAEGSFRIDDRYLWVCQNNIWSIET